MELRRALLLFAIVLGLAAIATSFTRPAERRTSERPRRPAPGVAPSVEPLLSRSGPVAVNFPAGRRAPERKLEMGRPGTVTVAVPAPGQVDLEGLGLTAPADKLTPAHFDVLSERPGLYEVRFTPAATRKPRTVGSLRIALPPER